MKPMHIERRFAFCAALSIVVVALGCSGDDGQENSSGSTGSGGADGGHTCTWDGTGGGVTIPDCSAYRNSCNLVGTIDGQHYDKLWQDTLHTIIPLDNVDNPQTLDLALPGNGGLHLEWPRPTVSGEWLTVTTGTLLLPLETTPRTVKPGSQLRRKCRESQFQYILSIDGGELTACSAN
jgi:hypothetical protein